MKKNYFRKVFLILVTLQFSLHAMAQEADEPIEALDTEVETEAEVEAEAGIGQTAGVVSLSAGAGANFPNANTAVMLSGALSQATGVPSNGIVGPGNNNDNKNNQAEFNFGPQQWPSQNKNTFSDVLFFLAESEAEVESEVEVEVNDGAAIATAGSSVGAAGVAASKYTTADGEIKVFPSNAVTSVDAVTSTSSRVSQVNIEFINDPAPLITGAGTSTLMGPLDNGAEESDFYRSNSDVQNLPFDIVYAEAGDEPVSQVETDTETEVETEAEAEAETAPGAAAAGATGGTATSVAGDFGVAISTSSVITSVSTSDVNDEEPAIFTEVEPASQNAENTGSGNENTFTNVITGGTNKFSVAAGPYNKANQQMTASELADVPTSENGKGLNSFESEAEAEVEVEAEVDNGAASVAAIAIAGTGSNGVASSVSGSSTTTASTSTENHNGVAQRENDQIFFNDSRNEELLEAQAGASAEAEAEAEAEANTALPSAEGSASATALGDAFSFGSVVLEDFDESNLTGPAPFDGSEGYVTSRSLIMDYGINGKAAPGSSSNSINAEAFNEQSFGEVEAEAEAEAEAEVGFNAAAAGAGSSAVLGKSGILPFDASSSSSSSTSTKVFDGEENLETENDSFTPDGDTEYPDIAGDLSDYVFEVEVETEVEAEVGINSAAVAVSAAGAGYPELQISTKFATTPYAAAGAAAAGETVTTSITMPAGNAAGNVVATATAEDSQSRGVSVAVAVAGVPSSNGIENEQEAESEGAGFASVSVSIYTDPADAATPVLLGGYESTPDLDLGQDEGGSLQDGIAEAEAEAESEAEAGYGVAAAAASAAASGAFAKSESFTSTSTLKYDLGYDFIDNLFVLTEATAKRTEADPSTVEISFNGFGYTSFSIQQKQDDGSFAEIGTLDRATPDIWEAYIFTVSNVDPDAPQQFKIVPAEDPGDEAILTLGGSALCTDIINIPDAAFKQALLANTSINLNGDMEIQCNEASNYQGELVFPQSGITDLTGIEAFIQVTEVDFSNNALTSADFSENLLLTSINLAGNDLTSLDVEDNNDLTTLRLAGNDLTSLTGTSDLDFLAILDARNNDLTSIDVSSNPLLKSLLLSNNEIDEIDVSDNRQLSRLLLSGNNLTSLDLTNNPGLNEVKLRNNNLESLDLRNSNNIALTNENIDFINNANLECVSVDTVSYAQANFLNIDSQTVFSADCAAATEPNEAPTAVCESITVSLDENGVATIVADDLDGGSSDFDGTFTLAISETSFTCDNIGENEVTLTVTDDDGAESTCVATVTVQENPESFVNIPEEIIVEAELDQCSAVVMIDASAASSCGALELGSDEPDDNTYDVGTTEVTFTLVNNDGTTSTFTTMVIVEDKQAPKIECIEDQTVVIASTDLYTVPDYGADGIVSFTDNCDDEATAFTQIPLPGEELGGGEYDIIIEAQDASGNSSTCTFKLIVDPTLSVASEALKGFSFYPNPASSELRIETLNELEKIDVYSVTGQLVLSQKSSMNQINVSSLAKGMYLMTITDIDGNNATKQFVKN